MLRNINLRALQLGCVCKTFVDERENISDLTYHEDQATATGRSLPLLQFLGWRPQPYAIHRNGFF